MIIRRIRRLLSGLPGAGMAAGRRLIVTALVAAVAAAVPASTAAADVNVNAKPTFLMPLPCGKTFYANSWIGHSPNNTIDWQTYGGDDINGEPALSAAPGTVTTVADRGNTSYGKYVVVTHSDGWTTLYAHLSAFSVSQGQSVSAGTRIGTVGATGGVSGPHLHFEERLNGAVQTPVVSGVTVPYGTKKTVTSTNCGGNPHTPSEVCGSGFSQIDSAALGTVGRVYLMYNASTGQNCVTTIKAVNIGTASAVSAYLEVQGKSRVTDSGNFAYYAGPVKATASSTCVKWGGSVGGTSYDSPFEHCG